MKGFYQVDKSAAWKASRAGKEMVPSSSLKPMTTILTLTTTLTTTDVNGLNDNVDK